MLRSEKGGKLRLGRFADEPTIEVGDLAPGQAGRLDLPLDTATQSWVASLEPPGELQICSLESAKDR